MSIWPFGMRRHQEAFERLSVLAALDSPSDPAEALRLIAEASAANLPHGNALGARFLAEPGRHFGVREAREGVIDGVRVVLVWSDPKVSVRQGGGTIGGTGSPHGATFVFADLDSTVPWLDVQNRPRAVPVSAGGTIGHPEFDARFLSAIDPGATISPAVIAAFLATEDHLFEWAVLWERNLAVHSGDPPGAKGEGDKLVAFAVSVAKAAKASAEPGDQIR